MEVVKWNHHEPITLRTEISGYLVPDYSGSPKDLVFCTKFKNKGYRNFAYWLHSFLTNTAQTLIDVFGNQWSVNQCLFTTSQNQPLFIYPSSRFEGGMSSSNAPHNVSAYSMYADINSGTVVMYLDPLDTKTLISGIGINTPWESGTMRSYLLSMLANQNYDWAIYFLLARVLIPNGIQVEVSKLYKIGYIIEFPSSFTRALPAFICYGGRHIGPEPVQLRDINGTWYCPKWFNTSTGTLDLMIGSDNTTPSPNDYNLKSPIASLSSQSQSIEIDTNMQECRLIRSGTYTPSSDTLLGEVGLFLNLYGTSGSTYKTMLCRATCNPRILLQGGRTYTIRLVISLG